MVKTMSVYKSRCMEKWMRKRGWNYKKPANGLRARIYSLFSNRSRGLDWGKWLMILTGTDFGGNWSEPEPPTWWYRMNAPTRMFITGYPQHPLKTFTVVKDYKTFMTLTEGLNEDQMYEWQAFNYNQDSELQVGHMYWGGSFYGMTRWELRLLTKYLHMVNRHGWYGVRHWLYSLGLQAHVVGFKKRSNLA